jgi:hypothetical protein
MPLNLFRGLALLLELYVAVPAPGRDEHPIRPPILYELNLGVEESVVLGPVADRTL